MKFLFLFLFICAGIGIGLYINAQESKIHPHEGRKIYAEPTPQSDWSNGVFVGNPRSYDKRWDLVTNQDQPEPFIYEPTVDRTWHGLQIVFGTILFAAILLVASSSKGNAPGSIPK